MTKVLKIEGMSCNHCVMHVSEALKELPGIEKVDVSLAEKRATVVGSSLDDAAMKTAVADAGYEVVAVE